MSGCGETGTRFRCTVMGRKLYYDGRCIDALGIYVGNGMMIHCGDPISYANINTSYWQQHFYTFGRLP